MDAIVRSIMEFYRRVKYRRYGWFGNYASWQEAQQKCTGYDNKRILEKIENAALKVKNGEAVYERDGVLYDKAEYSWPLLSHLLWIAQQRGNRLSVMDFGGSLGSTYFQNLRYLKNLSTFNWSIVEQTEFIKTGREKIAGDQLQFFFNIDDATAARGEHDVLLISCVLPYLEKPYDFLAGIADKNFPYIIIENTYFNPEAGDRLTIQEVPPYYYEASYPAWFLDYSKVKAALQYRYQLVEEYTNDQYLYFYGKKVDYRGFVMKLMR